MPDAQASNCILCAEAGPEIWDMPDGTRYLTCAHCDLTWLDPAFRLSADVERERYLLHQTEAEDAGYKKFVAGLIKAVTDRARPGARGLDFGAGHQPVLAGYLREAGYAMEIYDPFFWPDPGCLERSYDFVVACEVVEHFFDPRLGFAKMLARVKPGGVLVVNTEPHPGQAKFTNWYYRRDPSHVAFYSPRTFEVIGGQFRLARVSVEGRVAQLELAPSPVAQADDFHSPN